LAAAKRESGIVEPPVDWAGGTAPLAHPATKESKIAAASRRLDRVSILTSG
jgi:hypothetical protein